MDQPTHTDNGEAGKGNSGMSGGNSGLGAGGLSQSASTSSLPKLRLTLKVSTPSPELPTEPATSEQPSVVKKKRNMNSAKVGKPRIRGPNKSKLAVVEQGNAPEQVQSSTQAGSTGPTVTLRVMEKKELPAQFADQIQQLKELKKLKTRKWTKTQTTVKTLSGSTLILPIWAREGSFSHIAAPTTTGSRRASVDGTLNLTGETFACQEAGCNKVFDAKDKLKRHIAVHRKKAAKQQMKIPSLKLTINRPEAATVGANQIDEPEQEQEQELETAASSFPASEPPSEMTMMEDTQSHLESQI